MTREEVARKFDEIVAFAEVEKFIDTPVKRYSSGMYVRLAFAVAAHLDPEILIVDEVLAVGDAEFQKKCLGKMGDVAHEGRTVLFVSHNMASVKQLCTNGMLLNQGKTEFLGEIDSCIFQYTNRQKSYSEIISYGKVLISNLEVSSIKVNGSTSAEITLFSNTHTLNLTIDGYSKEPIRISPEVKLLDVNGGVIAYYCPAHFNTTYNQSDFIISGLFTLDAVIEMPILTKGDFFFDIFLTEPTVQGLWECRKGLHIISESQPMVTKHTVLENKKGHGAIILQGQYKVNQNDE
jgi:lipopolysaccharide transport system ATP-binding protein